MMSDDLKRRLLYILHRGLVEIRLLAKSGKTEQVHDLADILEVLPSWMEDDRHAPSPAEIKKALKVYEDKYPGSFQYSDFIDNFPVPAF